MELSVTNFTCDCLPKVVFAVVQFETSASAGNRAELDSVVVHEKEAIKCCRRNIKCSFCMAKRENLVLLVIISEKIVNAYGRIVKLCHMKKKTEMSSWKRFLYSIPPLLRSEIITRPLT
jgi:hypothetical protein